MNAEFNVWLLIVGLVLGAGLIWVVLMDGRRQEADVDVVELPREAAWLSAVMAEEGHQVSPLAAEQVLLLHRAYLGAPPPDPVIDEGRQRPPRSTGVELTGAPLESTSETPNVASPTSPSTAETGPTQ